MIHPTCLFFGGTPTIHDTARIDAHCIISGNVTIGANVHIGAGTHLFGSHGIVINDCASISSRVSIFSATDDYSEGYLTNPTIESEYRNVTSGPVVIESHAIIGCGSIVMPNITIHRGASVGALSFVNKSVPMYIIVTGQPIRKIGMRNAERLEELHTRRSLQNNPG